MTSQAPLAVWGLLGASAACQRGAGATEADAGRQVPTAGGDTRAAPPLTRRGVAAAPLPSEQRRERCGSSASIERAGPGSAGGACHCTATPVALAPRLWPALLDAGRGARAASRCGACEELKSQMGSGAPVGGTMRSSESIMCRSTSARGMPEGRLAARGPDVQCGTAAAAGEGCGRLGLMGTGSAGRLETSDEVWLVAGAFRPRRAAAALARRLAACGDEAPSSSCWEVVGSTPSS